MASQGGLRTAETFFCEEFKKDFSMDEIDEDEREDELENDEHESDEIENDERCAGGGEFCLHSLDFESGVAQLPPVVGAVTSFDSAPCRREDDELASTVRRNDEVLPSADSSSDSTRNFSHGL